MIVIADYAFKGPLKSINNISSKEGVFIILSEYFDRRYILDIDYASNIKKAIKSHDRRKCWDLYRKGKIRYAVLYSENVPDIKLKDIAESIRVHYKIIPCGAVDKEN